MSSIATIPAVPAPQGDYRTLADVWANYQARNQFTDSTIRQYEIQLRHFAKHLGRPATTADLDDDAVIVFLMDRAKKTTNANANKTRNHILALWRFAWRKRWVYEAPDVPRLKEPKRMPQAWTAAQFAKLVETAYLGGWHTSAMAGRVHICGIQPNLWWTGLLLVAYDSAARIGAIRHLRVENLDLDSRRLFIPAEVQKQYADQAFTLDPQTIAIVRQFSHVKRELLFPWPYDEVSFYAHYKAMLRAAGLPHDRRCGPHKVRRTTATLAEIHIGRGSATEILGHSSAAVTRAYIDTSMLPDARVAERLPRPLLVGLETETGDIPTAAEMLPAGVPAPVPIEHHVSAVILPRKLAGDDPRLDADPLTLLSAFIAEDFSGVKDWFRQRVAAELKSTFLAAGFETIRSLTATAVLSWFASEQQAGRLAATTAQHRIWAVMRFCSWLVRARGLYGLAREVDALARRSGRKIGRPKKGGAT